MKRKVLAVLFATALTAGMLSGCGSTDSTSDKADQKEESLEKETSEGQTGVDEETAANAVSEEEAEAAGFSDHEESADDQEVPVMQRTLHMKPKLLQTAPQTVQRIQTAQTENFPMVPRMHKWQEQL